MDIGGRRCNKPLRLTSGYIPDLYKVLPHPYLPPLSTCINPYALFTVLLGLVMLVLNLYKLCCNYLVLLQFLLWSMVVSIQRLL